MILFSEKQARVLHMSITGLFDAVKVNDAKKAEYYLKKRIDPNCTLDSSDVRPLHFAVVYDAVETATILMRYGADINAKDDDEVTPLDLTLKNDKMADILAHYGQERWC